MLVLVGVAILTAACHSDKVTSNDNGDGDGNTSTSGFTIYPETTYIDSTSIPVATPFPVRVQVTKEGTPVSNTPVAWTILTGDGTVSDTTTQTDAEGFAAVVWTIGNTVGFNQLQAKATDVSTTLRVFGLALDADSLARITADTSTIVATASLPIAVKVMDPFGNAVAGATVQWTADGGTIDSPVTVSGSSGETRTVFSTPAGTADYTVTATLPGIGSVSFVVRAL
jgi:adhesin/invasin